MVSDKSGPEGYILHDRAGTTHPSHEPKTVPTDMLDLTAEYSMISKQLFPDRNPKLTMVELLIYTREDLPSSRVSLSPS